MSWNVQDSIEIGLSHLYEHSPGEAYECFTSALNLEPNNEAALHYRAQVAMQLYDKRRDTALDDIEAAIRANPFKGELYLLENEILLSKNAYPEALTRLKKAPFKIFHNDPKITEIRELYERQERAQLNHVVKMPPEVIYGILMALPFSSRVKCLAVSRQWRETFSRIPDLWRDLDYYSVLLDKRTRNLTNHYHPYTTYNDHVRTSVHHSEGSVAASLDLFMQWADVRKLRIPLTNSVIEKLVQRRPALTEVGKYFD
ncbi:hypothetical protein BDB00DRAFT_483465 [Zychaea mexicana]|uniref:uncharacterized protein n=1 Tax=Zychaea mexicana TaxID=64656 RepID=UPI0022FE2365|nr:uncharacterized protein BDB00DRAFT_483465 [Zychaea mexicana]KAI9491474.1 hypothetical protein BDB00DRAFT_483465 [Zychaea mexicana]